MAREVEAGEKITEVEGKDFCSQGGPSGSFATGGGWRDSVIVLKLNL